MSNLYDPTATPVDHIIAALRDRQGYATRTADSWSRSQSPRSEQYAQRDREVVARLDQLIRAVETGLFDQLDASETGDTGDESLLPWERELLARTDVENLTAKEKAIRAAAWSAEAAAEDDGIRADWEREMPDLAEDDPARLPVEYFDAAEADDVREIRREMAIEAGDFDAADENDGIDDTRDFGEDEEYEDGAL